MATGYLTINKTSLSVSSGWQAYNDYGNTEWSTPSVGYGYVNVSVPSSMTGATFNSVSLTYNNSGGVGYKTIRFNSNGDAASNAAILSRLRNGTSLNLEFRFKANGQYPEVPYQSEKYTTETTTWSNIKILVDYTPPGKIGKSVTVTSCGTCEIRLPDVSLAAGESNTATLILNPTKAITKVVAKIRVGSSGHVETYTITKSVAANNSSSTTFSLAPLAAWFAAGDPRVNDAYVQFVYTSGGTDYSSSWTKITDSTYGDFKLLKTRSAPVISGVTFTEPTGTTTHISTYGNPIAGKTFLDVSFTVTLDTSADSGISQSSASFTIDNVTYTPNNNTCSLQPVASSGSVSYTVSVTDSYGQVGTLSSTKTFLAYTQPTMSNVSVERYATDVDQGGTTIYVLSDDSTTVWLNAGITVQTTLGTGTNAWRLDYTMDGGSSTNIYSNQSPSSVTLTHQRGVINDTVSSTDDHTFVITLSDQFTSFVATVVVPKAGAIFDIAPGGVAVGMRCTGTESGGEKFQVAYPAEFNGDVTLSYLDGKTYDTGWVDLSSYIKPGSWNGTLYMRRIGHLVQVLFGATLVESSLATSTWLAVNQTSGGTQIPLPEQWWPSELVYIPGYSQTPGSALRINATGYLAVRNQTGSTVKGTSGGGSWWLNAHGCYLVD